MKVIGIYIRKSRDSKNQKSLKEQQLLGLEFCKVNGYKAVIYNDGIVSGTSTENRPQYNQMLKDIADGKLYAIYLWNSDRVARDEIAWHTLANLLKENNTYLFDNGNKADFSNENTLLFYTIKSGMDAYFARVTSTKIKAVLKRNANEGKFSGILKFGYKRDKHGKTIIDKKEADIVKQIFQLSIDGKGYKAIADYLNDKNIPTRYNQLGGTYSKDRNLHGKQADKFSRDKSNAKWVSAVVGHILTSRNYIGEKMYNGKLIEIPSIISLSTFTTANERIQGRKNKHGKKSFKKYLLNDVLICGNCGKRYTGRKVNNHIYYRCASRIIKGGSCGSGGVRLDYLDNLIWDYFFNDDYLLTKLIGYNHQTDNQPREKEIEAKIKQLTTDLIRKEKELNNVTRYLLEDIIKADEADNQLKRIRTAINDIQLQLQRNNETLSKLTTSTNEIKDFQREIKALKINTPFDEKKQLIEKHINEIDIINLDGYFTVNIHLKSLNYTERFLFDLNYNNPSMVDIIHDNEVRERGFKNTIDWEQTAFDEKNTVILDIPEFRIYDMDGNPE